MALTAAISEVYICNLALSALRRSTIVNFNDTTDEEILSRLWYPIARDSLLEQVPWTFSTTRAKNLPPLTTKPAWGFRQAFALPSEALKVWGLETGDDVPWRVEGRTIVSDLDLISIVYTFRQVDPSTFSPTFVIALGKWLEAILALPLTGKVERRETAIKEAQFWIGEAASSNGQQGTPNLPLVTDLEVVRF